MLKTETNFFAVLCLFCCFLSTYLYCDTSPSETKFWPASGTLRANELRMGSKCTFVVSYILPTPGKYSVHPHCRSTSTCLPSSSQLSMSQPSTRPWISPLYTGTVQLWPMKQAMMSVPPANKCRFVILSMGCQSILCVKTMAHEMVYEWINERNLIDGT